MCACVCPGLSLSLCLPVSLLRSPSPSPRRLSLARALSLSVGSCPHDGEPAPSSKHTHTYTHTSVSFSVFLFLSPSLSQHNPLQVHSRRAREMLRAAGHSGRQFNPAMGRVLGSWVLPPVNISQPLTRYTVPAVEFRRMLAEAVRVPTPTNPLHPP